MSNWWANRLAQGQTNPSQNVRNSPPAPPIQQRPLDPSPNLTNKPKSLAHDEHCPGCHSTNYMASPGTSRKRCFDCGYPLVQSGTGVGTTKSDAPSKKATQVQSGGYSPTTIIGRVE